MPLKMCSFELIRTKNELCGYFFETRIILQSRPSLLKKGICFVNASQTASCLTFVYGPLLECIWAWCKKKLSGGCCMIARFWVNLQTKPFAHDNAKIEYSITKSRQNRFSLVILVSGCASTTYCGSSFLFWLSQKPIVHISDIPTLNLGNTEYWLYLDSCNLNEKDMSSKKTKPMFMWKRIFMWRWTNLLHIRQTHFKTFGTWCISEVCLAMKSSNIVVYFFFSLSERTYELKKNDKSSFVWFCSFTYESQ